MSGGATLPVLTLEEVCQNLPDVDSSTSPTAFAFLGVQPTVSPVVSFSGAACISGMLSSTTFQEVFKPGRWDAKRLLKQFGKLNALSLLKVTNYDMLASWCLERRRTRFCLVLLRYAAVQWPHVMVRCAERIADAFDNMLLKTMDINSCTEHDFEWTLKSLYWLATLRLSHKDGNVVGLNYMYITLIAFVKKVVALGVGDVLINMMNCKRPTFCGYLHSLLRAMLYHHLEFFSHAARFYQETSSEMENIRDLGHRSSHLKLVRGYENLCRDGLCFA